MKVQVFLADGGKLTIEEFDQPTALDLMEELNNPEGLPFLTFEMGDATVVVNRVHIVRVDLT